VDNKDITPEIKANAIRRARNGDSLIRIAEEIGVLPYTVYSWLPRDREWTTQKDQLVRAGRDLLKVGNTRYRASLKLGFIHVDRFVEWVLNSLPGLETLSPGQRKEIAANVTRKRDSGESLSAIAVQIDLRPEAIEELLRSERDPVSEVLDRFEKLLDAIEEQLKSNPAPDHGQLRKIQGVLWDKEIRVRDDLTEASENKNFSQLPKHTRDKYDELVRRFNEIRGHPLLTAVSPNLGKNLPDLRKIERKRGLRRGL
jgi:hypothetical protein